MIGPVEYLFPGHLSIATVLGNYSLHAVKNTFSLSSADTFNMCLNSNQDRREFGLDLGPNCLKGYQQTTKPVISSGSPLFANLLVYGISWVHKGLRVKVN